MVKKRKHKTKCKYCKYFVGGGDINYGNGICTRWLESTATYYHLHEDDFCSQGERKQIK